VRRLTRYDIKPRKTIASVLNVSTNINTSIITCPVLLARGSHGHDRMVIGFIIIFLCKIKGKMHKLPIKRNLGCKTFLLVT
jgi:hypothetical protein